MKKEQLRRTLDEVKNFNGHVLASTWIQCSPAEGVHGPFTDPGGRSELGSGDKPGDAWNRNVDEIHADAGILWWLEFVKQQFKPDAD